MCVLHIQGLRGKDGAPGKPGIKGEMVSTILLFNKMHAK